MSGALQRCLEECLKLITLSVIGKRFAVVAVEIRPPPARTKIGALEKREREKERKREERREKIIRKNAFEQKKKKNQG